MFIKQQAKKVDSAHREKSNNPANCLCGAVRLPKMPSMLSRAPTNCNHSHSARTDISTAAVQSMERSLRTLEQKLRDGEIIYGKQASVTETEIMPNALPIQV